jgi:23S rRNA pseudouridine1911/1915/1917 synthase
MFQLQDRSRTEEVYEHYNIVVDPGQQPMRIDKFLMGRIENVSRNIIQSAVQNGNVLVNDAPVKNNYKIKPKDEIKINFSTPPREVEITPQDIPISIVYEDEELIVINKEAGMVVHPGYNNYDGTLLNALCYHLSKDDLSNPIVPYLVHRIDKDTSGILLISKKERAQTLLAKQFYDHTIERKYIALAWGNFEEDNGTIDVNIGRSPKDRRVMTTFPEGDYGKHAVTHYKVIERFGYVSAIECQLETGRTHQIRAHMKSIGHPLFNDATYGGDSIIKGTTFSKYRQFVENCFKLIPRQALHAKSLGFVHPTTKEYMFFDSELPTDLNSAMEKWRAYSANQEL